MEKTAVYNVSEKPHSPERLDGREAEGALFTEKTDAAETDKEYAPTAEKGTQEAAKETEVALTEAMPGSEMRLIRPFVRRLAWEAAVALTRSSAEFFEAEVSMHGGMSKEHEFSLRSAMARVAELLGRLLSRYLLLPILGMLLSKKQRISLEELRVLCVKSERSTLREREHL